MITKMLIRTHFASTVHILQQSSIILPITGMFLLVGTHWLTPANHSKSANNRSKDMIRSSTTTFPGQAVITEKMEPGHVIEHALLPSEH
jgi:hypothetical protein